MRLAHLAALALAIPCLATPSIAQQAPPAASSTADLAISFIGVEEHKGAILVALYDQAGWSGGRPVRVAMADATAANPSATIGGLPAGRYGIKVFHDLDGDKRMGANPFGMPTEPFAFSNDAVGQRGVPGWEAASFEVAAGAASHSIKIR